LINLKTSVLWAIENDVDAILLIGKTFRASSYDFKNMLKTITELQNHGIYIFGLANVELGNTYIPVADTLYTTDMWIKEDTWIILSPLFSIIQDMRIELIENHLKKKPTAKDVLKILGHTKFTFSNGNEKIHNEITINIIIPFRNVKKHIESCIGSIKRQHYQNYRVFFIDDCSEDDSFELIPDHQHFFKTKNISRKYALENIIDTLLYNQFTEQDIICLVDGDDQLSHPYVFTLLNHIYFSEDVKITYGSFRLMGKYHRIGRKYSKTEFKNLREAEWKGSHLKTFRYSLFKQYLSMDPEMAHIKDSAGKVFKMPYDMAIMFPLLEIAGYNYSRFIESPLYIYNRHDNNDDIRNRELQINGEMEIRSKRSLTQ